MQYIMMPLDAHYDSGFGAIAESFRDAALALKKAVPNPAFFDHLPQSYLFRHATELFLKSEIVILHRKLKLAYGTEPYKGEPMVLAQGEWKPIHRVHSIGILYEYLEVTYQSPVGCAQGNDQVQGRLDDHRRR